MENERSIEPLARDLAKSLSVQIGTSAPFQIDGDIFIEKHGFADIPVVGVRIFGPDGACPALTPIARQLVYRELETHGLESEILEFVPTVKTGSRQRLFVDCNESSASKGRRKRGRLYEWRFEIRKIHVDHFVWKSGRGTFQAAGRIH